MKGETHLPVRGPEEFVRFNKSQRIEHFLMIISFSGLVITGLPQKFFGSDWAQTMIMLMGGIETTRYIHRVLALMFVLQGLYHVTYVVVTGLAGRFSTAMFPNRKDVQDALCYFGYCIGRTDRKPVFGKYEYRQKFEYWGVVMGWFIMVATGLLLTFPAQFTQFLPGVFVPAAKEMHGGEALMATLVIVVWHFYGAHLNPERFPADWGIFTGKISRERMMEEHAIEYARIVGIPLEEVETAEEAAVAHNAEKASREPQLGTQ
jgi:formate dehydrogenase subunit gamma